jgi:CopG family nickel-responsive transcriptional regulator
LISASAAGYTNRSEAFRDLIREVDRETAEKPDSLVVGTLTLVYDHHVRMLSDRLTAMQHDIFTGSVDTHASGSYNCLVLILKGKAAAVQKMADALISTKGVMHGRSPSRRPEFRVIVGSGVDLCGSFTHQGRHRASRAPFRGTHLYRSRDRLL